MNGAEVLKKISENVSSEKECETLIKQVGNKVTSCRLSVNVIIEKILKAKTADIPNFDMELDKEKTEKNKKELEEKKKKKLEKKKSKSPSKSKKNEDSSEDESDDSFEEFADEYKKVSQPDRVKKISESLKTNPLYIELSPSHHFIVIPIKEQVAIMQSYEDVYSLFDWIQNAKDFRLKKEDFVNNLTAITNKNKEAVLKLFSYKNLQPKKAEKITDDFSQGAQIKQCKIISI